MDVHLVPAEDIRKALHSNHVMPLVLAECFREVSLNECTSQINQATCPDCRRTVAAWAKA